MKKALVKLNFNEAFNKWLKIILVKAFPNKVQLFSGARTLVQRLNAIIHSESALTTLEMARSSLYTGVMVSGAIEKHFCTKLFSYEAVINKYPLCKSEWLAESMYPSVILKCFWLGTRKQHARNLINLSVGK